MDAQTHDHGIPVELGRSLPFAMGDIRVRPAERRLEGPAGIVSTEPRIMQLLVALSDAEGEVVSRDRLAERCWPGLVVGEDSLHRAVSGLRRALREAGSERVQVETVSKVGYRLCADEPEVLRPALPPAVPPEPATLTRRWMLGGAVGAAAVAGVGWNLLKPRDDGRADALVAQAAEQLATDATGAEGRARGLLEQAIGLTPEHARAWGLLAIAWQRIASFATAGSIAEAEAHTREAAARALQLERAQGDAHVALALLPPFFGDWQTAEQRLLRALDVSPDNPHGLSGLARLMAAVGRSGETLALADRLKATHPAHKAGSEWRIYGLWATRGAKAALTEAQADGEAASISMQVVGPLLMALTGRAADGEAAIQAVQQSQRSPSRILTALRGTVRAIGSGRNADVQAAETELLTAARLGGMTQFVSLLGLGSLGRTEAAYQLARNWYSQARANTRTAAERTVTLHRTSTVALFLPPLQGLRADARFLPLCSEIGLSAYWRGASQRPDFLAGQFLPF
ncbi:hypothetical protein FJQ54_09915 [Sandaracinobacter neustonicus]|uniref:OmpR/PhoB-type domain-containing protein n=1 Tax=Sandaracinobacter neustonicus TaxID=1715348 RepID=A0A501XKW4_9SPHN|nr:winged helix-turn-helix domain-containing protein [Sandaracinobacter neustonicus]TPE61196.1 hypothetical protein FJQ54_09915 [Sandaracinobacter neustonicus]